MELIDLKKVILIVILTLTTVSCELFSPSRWAEYEKDRAGSGRRCYEKRSGIFEILLLFYFEEKKKLLLY